MRLLETKLQGAYCIELDGKHDQRGFFARQWCARELAQAGVSSRIAQVNVCFNPQKGTLRGMHYQLPPYCETKFIRCIQGAVHDVIVDLRPDSETYGQWTGMELTQDNRKMLSVPPLFAHGYLTLTHDAEILYLVSEFYAPGAERGIRYDDEQIGIDWPSSPLLISEKDRNWPGLTSACQTCGTAE